jgi:hypothetical protein
MGDASWEWLRLKSACWETAHGLVGADSRVGRRSLPKVVEEVRAHKVFHSHAPPEDRSNRGRCVVVLL